MYRQPSARQIWHLPQLIKQEAQSTALVWLSLRQLGRGIIAQQMYRQPHQAASAFAAAHQVGLTAAGQVLGWARMQH